MLSRLALFNRILFDIFDCLFEILFIQKHFPFATSKTLRNITRSTRKLGQRVNPLLLESFRRSTFELNDWLISLYW